jgi:hypothetical protein
MTRIRGHFDGQAIVIDQPLPAGLERNTPVEIVVPEPRKQLLQEFFDYLEELWSRPLPFEPKPVEIQRRWKREELYERGGKPLA